MAKPADVDLEALAKKVTDQVVKRLSKNPPAANPPEASKQLSPEAIERLHELYEETGDASLGKLLDSVCDDPSCGDDDE